MLGIESIMDRVAAELQMPPEQVRAQNMYAEGERAICGQAVEAGQVISCCSFSTQSVHCVVHVGDSFQYHTGWQDRRHIFPYCVYW